jgi:hypothetical protein
MLKLTILFQEVLVTLHTKGFTIPVPVVVAPAMSVPSVE